MGIIVGVEEEKRRRNRKKRTRRKGRTNIKVMTAQTTARAETATGQPVC